MRFADLVQARLRERWLVIDASLQALANGEAAKIDQAIIGESARWGDARTPIRRRGLIGCGR